jgi:hypothetical protein
VLLVHFIVMVDIFRSTNLEMLQKGKECAQDLVNTLQQDFLAWHQQQAAQQQQMGAIASMQQPIQGEILCASFWSAL